jgi:uncharacterized HhH-GPD family protein
VLAGRTKQLGGAACGQQVWPDHLFRVPLNTKNTTVIGCRGPIFAKPPVLHRFPRAFAKRMHEVCQMLVEQYDGDAAKLWKEAKDGKDAVARIGKLSGFRKQKSQIVVAPLGKQFGPKLKGWQEATGAYGEKGALRSVADITESSLAKVRE